MAEISPDYASPGLRWGLLLEDYPGADTDYSITKGATLGLTDAMGAKDDFVVAVIHFPEGSGRSPATGWKPLQSHIRGSLDHPSDRYNLMCTKALGRALKRAGYPDDIPDLRAVGAWRKRNAEIEAIRSGTAQIESAAARPEEALTAAAKRDPEHTSGDDGNAPDTETATEPTRADDTLVPASSETKALLRDKVNALGPLSSELGAWARANKLSVARPKTEADALALIDQAETLLAPESAAAAPVDDPASEAPPAPQEPTGAAAVPSSEEADDDTDLNEVLAGLDAEERKAFGVFAKSIGVDPATLDWQTVTAGARAEILAWLAV